MEYGTLFCTFGTFQDTILDTEKMPYFVSVGEHFR